ncbi:hypothetical protein Bint_2247 [Brachyspira intermedia PWS/A]|uniref:Uncharacterized protein n=1 Tax=Brachyspira intermedia (strain ATCC 51140 / PWS/A) TaxID=1045858 RepID=G0EM04_BRAIP|nr:hypothetical protein [Brachyspira intermedia]AEM22853.1 hypothetical protein Bint_2247 [Brachyspira intermedia PWS/A]
MLNNLYFINIIDYEEYKKYNCFKLEELINYICDLIQDDEKFINIEENIKDFEIYQLIMKEIESIKESKIIYDRYKLFYFFLEEEYKLSYDNTEDIIKKINNFYNIYKSIEIPIKNI